MRKEPDETMEPCECDMLDEWENAAYDEEGNEAVCDICTEPLRWGPVMGRWTCPGCGREMSRANYFNHIGAEPPGEDCLTACQENYPFCKKICERYSIPHDDPMLT